MYRNINALFDFEPPPRMISSARLPFDHDIGQRLDQRHQRGLPHDAIASPGRSPSRSSRLITVLLCQRPPAPGQHAPSIELLRDAPEASVAAGANVRHQRPSPAHAARRCRRWPRATAQCPCRPAPAPRRRTGFRPHTTLPGHRQRLRGAPGDRLALLLRDQRHDADGQVVRLGQVDGGEVNRDVGERQRNAALRDRRSSFTRAA